MMVTMLDQPATGILTDTEIARFIAAGAQSVVVERRDDRAVRCIGIKMRRGDGDATKLFRWQVNLEDMPDKLREMLMVDMVRRVADYHETLPLTDTELEAEEAQVRR